MWNHNFKILIKFYVSPCYCGNVPPHTGGTAKCPLFNQVMCTQHIRLFWGSCVNHHSVMLIMIKVVVRLESFGVDCVNHDRAILIEKSPICAIQHLFSFKGTMKIGQSQTLRRDGSTSTYNHFESKCTLMTSHRLLVRIAAWFRWHCSFEFQMRLTWFCDIFNPGHTYFYSDLSAMDMCVDVCHFRNWIGAMTGHSGEPSYWFQF